MERRTIWGTMKRRKIDLEQGWDDIQKGITKLKAIVEGSGDRFTYEEYMKLYTTVYNMCNQKKPQWDDYCQRLYEMYKKALEEYINAMFLSCTPASTSESQFNLVTLGIGYPVCDSAT